MVEEWLRTWTEEDANCERDGRDESGTKLQSPCNVPYIFYDNVGRGKYQMQSRNQRRVDIIFCTHDDEAVSRRMTIDSFLGER